MGTARDDIAFLYRRAGFGARPEEIDAATSAGYETTVDRLLSPMGADPGLADVPEPTLTAPDLHTLADPAAQRALSATLAAERQRLIAWWLVRMASATSPWQEKLTLFWHGHFATSISKVRLPLLMYHQNQVLRTQGQGDFHSLTLAVAKDPAMLLWLDAGSDRKASPNENFARELMELFTLGIGNYTEEDVRAGARAFTGWRLDRLNYSFAFDPRDHDDGTKRFLGHTENLSGDDVIEIVTHEPASARWVASRLWSHFAYPVKPSDRVIDDLVSAYGKGLSLAALYRAMFLHPQFRSDSARTGLVKQPIEYVVGAIRALAPELLGPGLLTSPEPGGSGVTSLIGLLSQLGQVPFDPPNVGGWPQNEYWLTTASSLGALRLATTLARRADLSMLEDYPASDRVDAAGHVLGVRWSASTAAALSAVRAEPQSLMTLALTAPEYILS